MCKRKFCYVNLFEFVPEAVSAAGKCIIKEKSDMEFDEKRSNVVRLRTVNL